MTLRTAKPVAGGGIRNELDALSARAETLSAPVAHAASAWVESYPAPFGAGSHRFTQGAAW